MGRYEALFHRMDKKEYVSKVGAVKEREEAEKAAVIAAYLPTHGLQPWTSHTGAPTLD